MKFVLNSYAVGVLLFSGVSFGADGFIICAPPSSYVPQNLSTSLSSDDQNSSKIPVRSHAELMRQGWKYRLSGGKFGDVDIVEVAGKNYAVKTIKHGITGSYLEEASESLKREINFYQARDGKFLPHVLFCVGINEDDNHKYKSITLPLYGNNFATFLESNKNLSEDKIRYYFAQIISALLEMQTLGYAHFDIKPENILMKPDESLAIADFGLAALNKDNLTGKDRFDVLTCGSIFHVPPEVFTKEAIPLNDVHALMATLYRMMAGADFRQIQPSGTANNSQKNIEQIRDEISSGHWQKILGHQALLREEIKKRFQKPPSIKALNFLAKGLCAHKAGRFASLADVMADPWMWSSEESSPQEIKHQLVLEIAHALVFVLPAYNPLVLIFSYSA